VSFDVNQVAPDRPEPPKSGVLPARLRPWIQWVGTGRIVTTAIAVLAVAAGGWWLLRTPSPPTEAGLPYAATTTSPSPASTATATTAAAAGESPVHVVVHVAGAVAEPGVYELPSGARVHNAIEAAGGQLPRADSAALNLAALLVDGERIYVPRRGESVPIATNSAGSGSVGAPSGPVDVNHATVEELDELPGIGPTTAAAIVDHREQNGPFATVDDLEAVRGIGPAKLDAIRDLVTV
jgi:competence protein ComEA